MTGELSLRIVVENPLPGVTMQVQRGKDGLLPPSRSAADSLCFNFQIRLGEPKEGAGLRFLGEFAQGPAADRFVYVNSGSNAGQAGSAWSRRAKIKLAGISPEQVRRVMADPRLAIAARIAGAARDGGPACATVPLLDGWTVIAVG
jgi:hypothetical protein